MRGFLICASKNGYLMTVAMPAGPAWLPSACMTALLNTKRLSAAYVNGGQETRVFGDEVPFLI